jgi:hypothetical protein
VEKVVGEPHWGKRDVRFDEGLRVSGHGED